MPALFQEVFIKQWQPYLNEYRITKAMFVNDDPDIYPAGYWIDEDDDYIDFEDIAHWCPLPEMPEE